MLLFSAFFFAQEALIAEVEKTFFDECIALLNSDPHHLFAIEDAKRIQGDPRLATFIKDYARYSSHHSLQENFFYEKDFASTDVCNAFFRWTALRGCSLDVRCMTNKQLEDSIIHTNYLLHSFAPQSLNVGSPGVSNSFDKMVKIGVFQDDIKRELSSRQNVLCRSHLVEAKNSYLWVLGGLYDQISLLSWDHDENYLLASARKGQKNFLLIYSYDREHRDFSLCVEEQIFVDDTLFIEPTSLVWGPDSRTFILSGYSKKHSKDIAVLYSFNSIKKTVNILNKIAEKNSQGKTESKAFWIDRASLFVLAGGLGRIFEWNASLLSFSLKEKVFPGMQDIVSASASFDGKLFLTTHADFPYVRLSQPAGGFAQSSLINLNDKLCDAQWNPKTPCFSSRSQVEKDLVIFYRYDPERNKVQLLQRLHFGSDISRMKWTSDGRFLFVFGEANLMYGSGFRIYSLENDFLKPVDTPELQVKDLDSIKEAAFSHRNNQLLLVGKADHFMSGKVISPFLSDKNDQAALSNSLYKNNKHSFSWRVVDNLFNTAKVYDYLDDIPNQKKVSFGSVIMLVNAADNQIALSSCDVPGVVCAHDGRNLPCGKRLKHADFYAESLSSWWLVEGEQWLSRIDTPVRPFAKISLKNLATGERLTVSNDMSPIRGVHMEPRAVDFSNKKSFLSVVHGNNSPADWELGDRVSLVSRDDAIGLTFDTSSHPILKKTGIFKLSTKPQFIKTLHGDDAYLWVVNRNIAATTFFDQARQGSECAEFFCRRIDAISGKNAEAVRDALYNVVMKKSVLF